ncbi:MAG: amino-acid N-acetyltransferase [Methyloprofundus sp.]|nr:amino-acid N-acetyltransferase [Methyloprofundus sp.]
MNTNSSFVNWFRDSSPYIHAHRHRTFVIYFGGEALMDESFTNLIHDFALLNSLGIRLVLVHGIRPQIDSALKIRGQSSQFQDSLRITDKQSLQCVKESAGFVRVDIESLLSQGVANSPMSGAELRVISGNFITAQPLGVINGIDFQYTGKVRRIDSTAIRQQLDLENILLISPIGYSPSGDLFNLSAEQVATEIAISLQAEKLILMTEQSCQSASGELIAQMTTDETKEFINQELQLAVNTQQALKSAIHGCQAGVKRVHILNRLIDGALLTELFSRDGIGTLISSAQFESLRPAIIGDIPGILELISPLEKKGILISRSPEQLEINIADYIIIERDGLIIGCTALHAVKNSQTGLIACLAIHPDYQKSARGNQLLERLLQKAAKQSFTQVFAFSTQSMQWFIERGFSEINMQQLPNDLETNYNPLRNAKVLGKQLIM